MESEDLLTAFKSVNQSLRKRAITLGVLMVLAIALRYSENNRFEKVSDLMEYRDGLEQVAGLSDSSFRKVVDGEDDVRGKYFPETWENMELYASTRLFDRVQIDSYKKTLIYETVDELERKIEDRNQKQSIGILGLTISLEPVAYLSLVIVLILFHDFTQLIVFRNTIYRRIRGRRLPQWKLGFEFFGFYATSDNTTSKFLRFTSSIIVTAFIISPLAISYLMMNLNNSNSTFLLVLNIICSFLIIIDTLIIFHTENFGNFRYFWNLYLGRHNTSDLTLKLIWAIPLLIVFIINISNSVIMILLFGASGLFYCVFSLCLPLGLFFSMVFTRKNLTKRNRAIRVAFLILNGFWVIVTLRTNYIVDSLSFNAIDQLGEALTGVIFLTAIYSIIYMRFFMDKGKVNL